MSKNLAADQAVRLGSCGQHKQAQGLSNVMRLRLLLLAVAPGVVNATEQPETQVGTT